MFPVRVTVRVTTSLVSPTVVVAAVNPTYCYDLHATVLHALGIDHKRLTFRHNGIDRRLTDVHGHVIKKIVA